MSIDCCLISAPTAPEFGVHSQAEQVRLVAHHAPLGVLTLAAIARERGLGVEVVDLNRAWYAHLESATEVDFAERVARDLAARGRALYGLSTICSSYPLTLRIVQRLRAHRPDARIVLGGPQASSTAMETLRRVPEVDLIVIGEAEESFPAVALALAGEGRLEDIPGIAWRGPDGLRRSPTPPVLMDLDRLPTPAFDLLPGVEGAGYLPLELGRGCPYGCTFCSTNDFFRRRFRLRSAERVLADMRALHARYGITSFGLVHDMFTVDRRKVLAFCDALEGQGFTWSCSARTDRCDPELMERMRAAGCEGIFFGVETGSARLQKIVRKRLDLDQARSRIEAASRVGIETEVSLIAGFPEETEADLRDTLTLFAESLRLPGADANVGLLAPLPGTPLERAWRGQLIYDGIQSDMARQGERLVPEDEALILAWPELFTQFYAAPTPSLDRLRLVMAREFAVRCAERARWLLVTLQQDSGDLLAVMDRWLAWRGGAPPLEFFQSGAFIQELLRFVESAWPSRAPQVIQAVVAWERAFGSYAVRLPAAATSGDGPRAVDGLVLIHLPVSWRALRAALEAQRPLEALPPSPCWLAAGRAIGRSTEVFEISEPLASLLQRCDGRPLDALITWNAANHPIPGIPAAASCEFALERLASSGLLTRGAPPTSPPRTPRVGPPT